MNIFIGIVLIITGIVGWFWSGKYASDPTYNPNWVVAPVFFFFVAMTGIGILYD
jgi:hypothetical protein